MEKTFKEKWRESVAEFKEQNQAFRETIGFKNNNFTNIRYNVNNNWLGQTGENKGFCVFSQPIYGLRTTIYLLNKYVKFGNDTIEKIIRKWAPNNENDTENYIKFVEQHTSLHRSNKLYMSNKSEVCAIVHAMIKMEIGMNCYYDQIEAAYDFWLNGHIEHPVNDTYTN